MTPTGSLRFRLFYAVYIFFKLCTWNFKSVQIVLSFISKLWETLKIFFGKYTCKNALSISAFSMLSHFISSVLSSRLATVSLVLDSDLTELQIALCFSLIFSAKFLSYSVLAFFTTLLHIEFASLYLVLIKLLLQL